jgi:hypothetical protein
VPAFDFGHLRIVGNNHSERRDFVILESDIVVLIGGSDNTKKLAECAYEFGKPVIPIGIGSSNDASVQIWHELIHGPKQQRDSSILREDLEKIGPAQFDLQEAAKAVANICMRLTETPS